MAMRAAGRHLEHHPLPGVPRFLVREIADVAIRISAGGLEHFHHDFPGRRWRTRRHGFGRSPFASASAPFVGCAGPGLLRPAALAVTPCGFPGEWRSSSGFRTPTISLRRRPGRLPAPCTSGPLLDHDVRAAEKHGMIDPLFGQVDGFQPHHGVGCEIFSCSNSTLIWFIFELAFFNGLRTPANTASPSM